MRSEDVIIRNFTSADLAEVTSLTNELGYPTSLGEMQKRMKEIAQHQHYRTIVAEVKGKVVGYAGLVKSFFWEQNGTYVRIQALVVKSGERRIGVGRNLIQEAERWATEVGAGMLFLNCGNRNEREGAHKFYNDLGFEGKSTGYVKKLT
jgi:GNAT superfamily N-acetyltransferase